MKVQKWEYLPIDIDLNFKEPLTKEMLNELGTEGWELVNLIVLSEIRSVYYIFKRPLQDEETK